MLIFSAVGHPSKSCSLKHHKCFYILSQLSTVQRTLRQWKQSWIEHFFFIILGPINSLFKALKWLIWRRLSTWRLHPAPNSLQQTSRWMYRAYRHFKHNKHQNFSEGDRCGRHVVKRNTSLPTDAKFNFPCSPCERTHGNVKQEETVDSKTAHCLLF